MLRFYNEISLKDKGGRYDEHENEERFGEHV